MTTRTCLVTGANSGLGLATAVELAKRGHRVVGTVRSKAKAEPLHRAADEAGVEIEHRLLDVVDAERGAEVIDEIRPDVLVNNAGYGMSAPVELVDDAEASQLLDTMLLAPVRLARQAIPHQRERGGGHIVMISSILGRITVPMTGWYQAAKHGLEAVSDALRQEVAGDGIHVVLVEPGFFRTGIFDDLDRDAQRYAGQGYDEAFRRARQTLERSTWAMGDPGSVADTVARAVGSSRPRARYLVGPDARTMDALTPWVPTAIRDRMARFAYGL
jgi:NAD(P)-dependent dehydrogenase (short-subunit alcohol dehydrogenase family)